MSELDPQGKTPTLGEPPDWKVLLAEARADASIKTEPKNPKDVFEELGIEMKPYKPTLLAWFLRLFGLALVCSIIVGVPYAIISTQGNWLGKDAWGAFIVLIVWVCAARGLWRYLFVDKDWKNPP